MAYRLAAVTLFILLSSHISTCEFSLVGCFRDYKDDTRILPDYHESFVNLTSATCIRYCKNKELPYAGTKRRNCFCGNGANLEWSDMRLDSDCNITCRGNASEMCGGAYRMNVYTEVLCTYVKDHTSTVCSWRLPSYTTEGSGTTGVPTFTNSSTDLISNQDSAAPAQQQVPFGDLYMSTSVSDGQSYTLLSVEPSFTTLSNHPSSTSIFNEPNISTDQAVITYGSHPLASSTFIDPTISTGQAVTTYTSHPLATTMEQQSGNLEYPLSETRSTYQGHHDHVLSHVVSVHTSEIQPSINVVLSSTPTSGTQVDITATSTSQLLCKCSCHALSHNSFEISELKSMTNEIKNKLLVKKSLTSKFVRSKVSARDDRASSSGIGALGIILLCVVFGSLVLSDITNLVAYISSCKK